MRRLAVQSRNDAYRSRKDYQEIHTKRSQQIHSQTGKVIFSKFIEFRESEALLGFGGFIAPYNNTNVSIQIEINDESFYFERNLINNWNRVGACIKVVNAESALVRVHLHFDSCTNFSAWGLELDELSLTEDITSIEGFLEALNQDHLVPETYYFEHSNSIDIELDEEQYSHIEISDGIDIELKKCSFCQRYLPLRSDSPGAISFHKHNAKISNHQNECRSCKKWRINNTFNPLRTTDQLHESSVITRERKLLLREPLILQEIKERSGAGLKSQIWEKFDRKCFFCKEPVALNEFQLDHTRPLAYLWPIDEHATCLCPEHNNQKKDKFPVDFYSKEQLVELSKITGLSLEELTVKDINIPELQRIIDNIVEYSRSWDARTFNAIARKVIEIRTEIDLFSILKEKSEQAYQSLISELEARPESVF